MRPTRSFTKDKDIKVKKKTREKKYFREMYSTRSVQLIWLGFFVNVIFYGIFIPKHLKFAQFLGIYQLKCVYVFVLNSDHETRTYT